MWPDDIPIDEHGALDALTPEQREHLVANENRWRKQRLREDIEEAKRRLETAMQLLADATVFLDDEPE